MHSVGSLPHSLLNIEAGRPNDHNIDVPLNYADYYFLEALIRKGRVEKGENPIRQCLSEKESYLHFLLPPCSPA